MSKGKDRFELVTKKEVDKVLHIFKPVLGKLNKYVNENNKDCVFYRQIVGSTSRGVVSRIKNGNLGFDIDINLVINYPGNGMKYNGKMIHTTFLNGIRYAIKDTIFSDPEESSSVFTLKCKDREHSRINYGVDLAVIYYDPEDNIHYLQYNKSNGGFGFQIKRLPIDLSEMKERIMDYYEDGEDTIINAYIKNKNSKNGYEKHSFVIYAETIHNLYNQIPEEDYYDEDYD